MTNTTRCQNITKQTGKVTHMHRCFRPATKRVVVVAALWHQTGTVLDVCGTCSGSMKRLGEVIAA